ncbi:MAG: hypothetical protein SO442_07550 [Prevotella sp.]|nr:hypothetical protein [Prevotella sp.]MDY4626445.1 hypothetical protein [Prevotella sp.]
MMILDGSSLADAPLYVPAGGGMSGARPAQGAATTTDVDYRLWDDWREDYN